MSRLLNNRVHDQEFENLIAGLHPPLDAFSVDLRAGQGVLQRGTALALSSGDMGDGCMVILGTAAGANEELTANCVLADPVDTGTGGAVHGIAYRTGSFNTNALITKDEYAIAQTDKEAFRQAGILLSDAVG